MLSLYNTLSRSKEPFTPLQPGRVSLYTCGPTVWNFAHIGNFRTFVFEDVLRRYLEYLGMKVEHVMNLTDVDDRTIKAANEAKLQLRDHVKPFTEAFFQDRDYLRIEPATHYTAATAYVPQQIRLVETLLAKGVAYRGDDGSVYFAIGKFPQYGRLSRVEARTLKDGARVSSDEYSKDDARDFVLWKAAKPEDETVGAAWDAPFGRGRPGWHLECSAMAQHHLGDTLDIHCGGVDLIFPHHEDEIAQSEAATGKPFARYWMHGEFLQIDGTKMSKRFGNFLTARDLKESGVDPAAIRYLFGQTHYRKQLNWSDDALKAASAGAQRLGEFHTRLLKVSQQPGCNVEHAWMESLEQEFRRAMDDDLDVPGALAAIQTAVREGNAILDTGGGSGDMLGAFDRVTRVLQVVPALEVADTDPEWARARELAEARKKAKWAKKWAEADKLRDELHALGFEARDTKEGGYDLRRLS